MLAPNGAAANGTITVTGTETREELRVPVEDNVLVVALAVAVSVARTGGTPVPCTAETDPLVGRPVAQRCGKLGSDRYDVSVDLRGGSDAL